MTHLGSIWSAKGLDHGFNDYWNIKSAQCVDEEGVAPGVQHRPMENIEGSMDRSHERAFRAEHVELAPWYRSVLADLS